MLRVAEVVESEVNLTPLQLLAVILKTVLQDRITDDEVERICTAYYEVIVKEFS